MEGSIGPVAGSSHHSLYYRMPGIKIASPMTPKEYLSIYDNFMKNEDVLYVSEHRGCYPNKEELPDSISEDLDIMLFPISITRFEAQKAKIELEKEGYKNLSRKEKYVKLKPKSENKRMRQKIVNEEK